MCFSHKLFSCHYQIIIFGAMKSYSDDMVDVLFPLSAATQFYWQVLSHVFTLFNLKICAFVMFGEIWIIAYYIIWLLCISYLGLKSGFFYSTPYT
jgi:hypothetical protein